MNKYAFSLLQFNYFPNRQNSQNFWFVIQNRQIMNNWGKKLLLTIALLSRLLILLLLLPVLSHLRAPSCFLALWGSSCIVSLSCGLEKFPLASLFWLCSATSRSFPWDISAGDSGGFWLMVWTSWSVNNSLLCTLRLIAGISLCSFYCACPPFKEASDNNGVFSNGIFWRTCTTSSSPVFLCFLWAIWVHLTSFEGLLMCIFSSSWSTKVGCF